VATKEHRPSTSAFKAGLLLMPVGLLVSIFGLPALDGPKPPWYQVVQGVLMLGGVSLFLIGFGLTIVGIFKWFLSPR